MKKAGFTRDNPFFRSRHKTTSFFEPLKAELSKLKASGYDPNYESDKLNIIS